MHHIKELMCQIEAQITAPGDGEEQLTTIEIPLKWKKELLWLLDLLSSGEIESLGSLLEKAGISKQGTKLQDKNTEIASLPSPTPDFTDGSSRLTPDQEAALSQLKEFTYGEEKFFRLTGFAGTGKTFLITHYIRWLIEQEINFVAATPTNKAAKNLLQLAEDSGLKIEVKTVAQLLRQQPVMDEDKGVEVFLSKEELDWSSYGVIIVDEFSMVNQENFKAIAIEVNSSLLSKVVFVGDNAQLPPVGEYEPIVSSTPMITETASLTSVVRYDGELALVAEAVRTDPQYSRRIYPFETTQDSTIVCLPQQEWLEKAIALFKTKQFELNPDHVRFLAWRNKTVDGLNRFVRAQLWGENAPSYLPGDRLIAKRPLFRVKPGQKGKNKWGIVLNNSEEAKVIEEGEKCELLFDGQIYQYWKVMVEPERGKIKPLLILHQESKELHRQRVKLLAQTKQWQKYYDLSRMFDDVAYAYGLTVHKSQGSSIDYVFLDAWDIRGCSERQKLQYTALTRAKTRVLIRE